MDHMNSNVGVIKLEPETISEEGSSRSHCDAILQYGIVKQETEDASAIKFEPETQEHVQECGTYEIDIEYPDVKGECFDHLVKIDQSREFVSTKSSIIGTTDQKAKQSVKTKKKSFSCPACTYRCSNRSHMVSHIRTHTGEKPLSCSECTYRCSEKSGMVRHIKTHTGEKPFTCPNCNYRCSRKSHMVLHIRTHTGKKPFSCSQCTYKFNQKASLIVHTRTHTGEKPFSCSECPYKCSHKSNMIRHIRTHIGEKSFS